MNEPREDKPRIGALGVGWIGRHRMEAVADSGQARVVALCDPNAEAIEQARRAAPRAEVVVGLDEMLAMGLDGLMIATPSALHAEQTMRVLEAGVSVFCQKPLGRTAAETRRVVDCARRADRLLGVDFSYRHTEAMQRIRPLVSDGQLGHIYAVDLVFHNAYGPDKDWFYDLERSGGGCLIDLGIHLVDLALWTLEWPEVQSVSGQCMCDGQRVDPRRPVVEDYASAVMQVGESTVVDIACSWRLSAGRDAVIEAAFYGTEGGARLRNVDGSFYDFVAERYRGTDTEVLCEPPDAWGGRAAIAWADKLGRDASYDGAVEQAVRVAELVDTVYGR